MSNTFHLLTTQGGILPATYPLTITATQTGYSPLTVTISITVTPVSQPSGVDTVRSLTELLTVIWRDGQADRELTAQDVRDTIVSLALQTGDFSRLPTSNAGLPAGRVFLDGSTLRVNLQGIVYSASMIANGAGSLVGNARQAIQHATSALRGAGSITASARLAIQHATARFNGVGAVTGTIGTAPEFLDQFTTLSMDNLWATPQTTGTWMVTRDYAPDNTTGWPLNDGFMVNPFNPSTPDIDLYQASGGNLLLGIKQTPSAQLSYCGGQPYVSSQIISHFSRLHGYFEARAQFSVATPGLNQAIWLFITDPGYYQEIDIVEFVTGDTWTDAQQAVHNLNDGSNLGIDHFSDQGFDGSQWHTYGVNWQSDFITFYIDRQPVPGGRVVTPAGYTQPMHIWISQQQGAADWSGPITNPAALPTFMTVDYVAVWADKPFVDNAFSPEFSAEFF